MSGEFITGYLYRNGQCAGAIIRQEPLPGQEYMALPLQPVMTRYYITQRECDTIVTEQEICTMIEVPGASEDYGHPEWFCWTVYDSYTYCYDVSVWVDDPVGGGSGGGGGTPPSVADKRPRPKDIKEDCSGNQIQARADLVNHKTLFENIQAATVGTTNYIDYPTYQSSVWENNSVEHSTSVIDYGDGGTYLTPVIHGSSSNVTIDYSSSYIVGSIHNHPNGTPPSAVDIMTTGNIAGQRGSYRTTTVYIPAQNPSEQDIYYMIHVDDAQKAAAFADTYGSQIDPATNWFSTDSEIYAYLRKNQDFMYLDRERQIFELADVLSSYNAGMSLYKIMGDNTSEGYGVIRENGNSFLTPIKCR